MILIHVLALDTTRKGGAGVYTANLIIHLARLGYQIVLICHEATDEIKAICEVHELRRPRKNRRYGSWRFDACLQILDYKDSLTSLKLPRPDIIIGSAQPMTLPYIKLHPATPFIYIPHSLVAPIEISTYQHAGIIQRWVAINTYDHLERKCLSHASLTIRFSEAASKTMRDHYGEHCTKKMQVITMPIDIPQTLPDRSHRNKIRFLSVGRLIKSKNINFLLDTLSHFKNYSWHLDIIGEGDEKYSLIKKAKDLGIDNYVTFYGQQNDINQFYEAADIFLFPSLLENYALVVIEAMSWGLPVLGFYPDGERFKNVNPQIINNGCDGFLVNDENQFKEFIYKFVEKKFALDEIGRAAHNTVVARNSWQHHIAAVNRHIIDIYSEVRSS